MINDSANLLNYHGRAKMTTCIHRRAYQLGFKIHENLNISVAHSGQRKFVSSWARGILRSKEDDWPQWFQYDSRILRIVVRSSTSWRSRPMNLQSWISKLKHSDLALANSLQTSSSSHLGSDMLRLAMNMNFVSNINFDTAVFSTVASCYT